MTKATKYGLNPKKEGFFCPLQQMVSKKQQFNCINNFLYTFLDAICNFDHVTSLYECNNNNNILILFFLFFLCYFGPKSVCS